MENKLIFMPIFGQVALTFMIWVWLYVTRLSTMARDRIDPQVLADESGYALLRKVAGPSDNFENLFELPVLFFALGILIIVSGKSDPWFGVWMWGFVWLRALHSIIHCTYNRITHRFAAYFLSALILWGLWLRLFLKIAIGG
jgi:hypothetical protein